MIGFVLSFIFKRKHTHLSTHKPSRFHVADYDDYSHRHGIIIVYDISNQETFNNVEKWLEEIDSLTHKRVSRVLVGNKLDLDTEGKREVSYERAKDFAERKGIDDFIEVSAKDGANVDECFQRMAECILCGLGGNEEVFFFFFFISFFFLRE